MQDIVVRRYENPKAVGWAGWLEPRDKSWIAFIGLDGKPLVFLNRDPVTGGILPDDPEEREAHLKTLRGECPPCEEIGAKVGDFAAVPYDSPICHGELVHPGRRTGMLADGSADYGPEHRDPHELGEVIHPLGISGGGGDVVPLPARESKPNIA